MALIDDLSTMAKLMRRYEDKMFLNTIYGGASMLDRLPPAQPRYDASPFYGMKVVENRMFPYEQSCSKCDSTGEGDTSTYCSTCRGAGRYRVEGVATGGTDKMVVIMHYYPPKPVRWPSQVMVPRRPTPGIRTMAWPPTPTA